MKKYFISKFDKLRIMNLIMDRKFNGYKLENDPGIHYDFNLIKSKPFSDESSDLRGFSMERHDQSHSGSCVAQSVVKALEIKRVMKYGASNHVNLSRLAVYYLARMEMKPSQVNNDDGTYISLAADVIRRFGVCREEPKSPIDTSFWPFNLELVNKAPSWMAMRSAYQNKISSWYKIYSSGQQRIQDISTALKQGHPIVFGTKVCKNFTDYNGTPIGIATGECFGGHATVIVGNVPKEKYFWVENSWGKNWGPDNGFYKLSYDVISSKDSNDFLVMKGSWE